MINILHICVNFNNPLYDKLIINLSRSNIHQQVIYPIKSFRNADLEKYLRKKSYRVDYLKLHPLTVRLFYLYKLILIYKFINKVVDISTISIVHAHTLFSDGGVAMLLSRYKKTKYIVTIRETDFKIIKYKPWLRIIGRKILRNSSKIICISPNLQRKLLKYYKDPSIKGKIQIIPNGIDEQFFLGKDTGGGEKKVDSKRIKLLYVGTFIPRKNVRKIINFVLRYNDYYSLTLVGGGGQNAENYDRLLLHSESIRYTGKIKNRTDLINAYNNCDVFIMISENETFGQVYLEAMSQGKPVIYSNGTGIDNFFEKGLIGCKIDLRDYSEEVLHKKISFIKNNYKSISTRCIHESKEFRWDTISKSYVKLYSAI